jgi:MFS family permease
MAAQAIPTQRWVRIIPITFLMYTIAFMDRNNIAFSFSGMQKDLAFAATGSGLAAGIFFFGYLLLQVPGALLAEKWSAKRFIMAALLVWGVMAMATGFVQNLTQLLIIRFLLGVVEGGVAPAAMILLTKWFPLNERSRANALFYLCMPVGSAITGPISGWILTYYDWRMLFILEGLPAVVWAVVWWFGVDDSPRQAKWISPAERDYLEATIEAERKEIKAETPSIRQLVHNRNVILLLLVFTFMLTGYYGYGLWLPTVVKALSQGSIMQVGWLTTIPWICAMIGSVLMAMRADKTRDYKFYIAGPLLTAALFLTLSVLAGQARPVLAFVALSICMGFMSCHAIFWTALSAYVAEEVLAVAMGVINAVANLGGFFGPFLVGYLIDWTGTIYCGEAALIIALIIAGCFAMLLRNRLVTTKTIKATDLAAAAD